MSAVNANHYSIGYVSYNFFLEFSTSSVRMARLENVRQEVIEYTTEAAQASLAGAVFDDRYFSESVIDIDAPGAYPITTFTYVIIDKDWSLNCEQKRQALRFFVWALTNEEARFQADAAGFIPLPESTYTAIVDDMRTVSCDGETLVGLRVLTKDYHGGDITLIVLLCILTISSMIILGHWIFWPHRKLQVRIYGFVIMIGVLAAYLSCVLWIVEPSSTAICMLRLWISALACAMILGATFARSSVILRVFTVIQRNNKFNKEIRGLFVFLIAVTLAIAIQVLILVLWSSIDTYKSTFEMVDALSLDVYYACRSENETIWGIIEILYFLALVLWGASVVYSTWTLKGRIYSSRWMLIHLYNVIMVIAIGTALLYIFSDKDSSRRTVAIACILVVTTSSLVSFAVPDIVLRNATLAKSSQSAHSTVRLDTATPNDTSNSRPVSKQVAGKNSSGVSSAMTGNEDNENDSTVEATSKSDTTEKSSIASYTSFE